MPKAQLADVVARALGTRSEQTCDIAAAVIVDAVFLERVVLHLKRVGLLAEFVASREVLDQLGLVPGEPFLDCAVYEGEAGDIGCLRFKVRPLPQ